MSAAIGPVCRILARDGRVTFEAANGQVVAHTEERLATLMLGVVDDEIVLLSSTGVVINPAFEEPERELPEPDPNDFAADTDPAPAPLTDEETAS